MIIHLQPWIKTCLPLILFSWPLFLTAQISDYHAGAKGQAMGNATIAHSDSWSVFNNIGALAGAKDFSIGMACSGYHQIDGFNSVALSSNIPVNDFHVGAGIFYFGDEVFNEGKMSLGICHKINFISIGVNFNYLQYNVQDFGTSSSFAIEMGGKATIHPRLELGAHIFNINRAVLSRQRQMKIPTIMSAGISYRPTDITTFNLQIEKNPPKKSILRIGMEYKLAKQFAIRTGISTYPTSVHFGMGFMARKIKIDYALSHNHILGVFSQISSNISIINNHAIH